MSCYLKSKNRWKYIRIALRCKVSPQIVCDIAHGEDIDCKEAEAIISLLLEYNIIHRIKDSHEK